MPEVQHPTEVTLRDPLTPVARAERRSLLASSTVGLVIAWVGLVPQRIATFGIEFSRTDRETLLNLVAAVIVYYLVAFCVYAFSDLAAWRVAYGYAVRESIRRRRSETEDEKYARIAAEQQDPPRRGFALWYNLSKRISMMRAIFDFGLPIVVAVVAVVSLFVVET